MQQIQDKAKESCMVSFRQLHSHLKVLSNNDLKGTRTECGFKRAFATLFGQDVESFTGTMFLNMDQLEKQLDNKEFQDIGSMVAFKVLETQFQMFIKSRIYLDDEYVIMTCNYFLQYTQLEISEFYDTLIQHMEFVKKSIDKRSLHKRDGTESKKHDTNNRSGNDTHTDDTDIKPIYDEEPMAEVQTTAEINVFATGQQHTEQPNSIMKERNQSVVRQSTAFKSERHRISKPRFASQVDVNNDLSKPITTHYLPKERDSAIAKPHHMIAPSSSRWKQTGRIFNSVGLRWVPTGKIFTSSITKVDSEPTNGSNEDITNQYECEQTLDVSAGTNDGVAASFQLKSDSLPHAHAQTTKTYYKHQDSRIKKAQ
nr:hypothetical protein [Tanacetum cinerariifolium]